MGVKLVLPHTIHNAQVGHELYVGFCPVRNHPAVGIGQWLRVIMDLIAIQPIGPRQNHSSLLPGNDGVVVHVSILTALKQPQFLRHRAAPRLILDLSL